MTLSGTLSKMIRILCPNFPESWFLPALTGKKICVSSIWHRWREASVQLLVKQMTIQDRLSELRTRFEGCEIAAFADLSTQMVLASSAGKGVPQEQLDTLCAEACEALLSNASDVVKSAFSAPQNAAISYSVVPRQGYNRVYVTSPETPEEAICLQCIGRTPVGDILSASCSLLSIVGSDI